MNAQLTERTPAGTHRSAPPQQNAPSPQGRTRQERFLSGVPLWVGRALQLVAVTMLVLAGTDTAMPDGVYGAAYYFSVLGLSPDPILFNAILLFFIGSASKRRLRGAFVCLVIFEIPTILVPIVALLGVGDAAPEYLQAIGTIDVLAAVLATAFVCLLVTARHEYSARIEPGSGRRALAVVVAGVGVAVLAGGALSLVDPAQTHALSDIWWWSLHTATGIYPAEWVFDGSTNGLSPWVGVTVASLSASGVMLALWMLLRSARRMRVFTEHEEIGVRRLLRNGYTEDSLAYFATRRDKSVVFSTGQAAAISYRVVNGVALASGDPLGPESAWNSVTEEWLRVVRGYGWRPAVLAATEQGATHYAKFGMHGAELGDEAVLTIDRAQRPALLRSAPVRAARRRAQNTGYTAQIRRQRDMNRDALQQIEARAAEWRGAAQERGFSMALSRVGDPSDGDSVVVTAHDEANQIRAILVFAPWNSDGLSLDVMRRHPDAMNGVNEFMIGVLAAEASALGVRRISLNFAVFRDVLVRGARVGAGPLLRAQRWVLMRLSAHWQLDSLRRANEKYGPQWRPRFLMWSRQAPLAWVMCAVARAEGFARVPLRGAECAAVPRNAAFYAQLEGEAREAETDLAVVPQLPPVSARAAAALAELREGVELYPPQVPRTCAIADLGQGAAGVVSITGRVVARRAHGSIVFVDLVEQHAQFQIIATAHVTPRFRELLRVSLGDIISVTGTLGATRTGQPSVWVEGWVVASKALRTPPNRRTGLRDPEAQLRQRHVHLATSSAATELLRTRSAAIRVLRDGLLDEGFLEVETPILQRTHGGANARPFRTHIHAYHRDLSLRIAPELALKKLIIGGIPQVFEIGRNFRNEGVDATHNPEFTAVEAYRAFADYQDMRVLAEHLVKDMLSVSSGVPTLVLADGSRHDVSGAWRVVTVCDAVSERTGTHVSLDVGVDALRRICERFHLSTVKSSTPGQLIEVLYESLVEPETILPTFYCDFPSETSPLARPHRSVEGLSERWDLVAAGMELGTAYSELIDPFEQRRRLTAQSIRAAGGCVEAMQLDEDFLAALEFGMPPTGGLGLGVDRVVMAATGVSIRQTLTFPFVA